MLVEDIVAPAGGSMPPILAPFALAAAVGLLFIPPAVFDKVALWRALDVFLATGCDDLC